MKSKLSLTVLAILTLSQLAGGVQYRLVPDNFLDTGNNWYYDLDLTVEGSSYTGTSSIKVIGTASVGGYNAQKVEFLLYINSLGWEKSTYFWKMSSGNVIGFAEWFDSSYSYWSRDTIMNDNPAEIFPLYINDSDNHTFLGSHNYSGSDNNGNYTGSSNQYITYLGHETVTVPAGVYDCIYVRTEGDWNDSSAGWDDYYIWFSPDIGIVKMQGAEYEDGERIDFGIELTSTNVQPTVSISDHVYYIDIWQEMFYENSTTDITYGFEFDIETDSTVNSVSFLTPNGQTFTIPYNSSNWDEATGTWTECEYNSDDDIWEWEYSREQTSSNHLEDFGDGWYTITIGYTNGGTDQTRVWFNIPLDNTPIPQPTQIPVPTNPLHRDGNVAPSVTLNWELCVDQNVESLYVELWNESTGEEYEADLPKTAISWQPPSSLSTGFWEAGIYFDNWYAYDNTDSIPVSVGKSSGVDYEFAVGVPWAAYEVYGGNSYPSQSDTWNFYYNIDQQQSYARLGTSDGESKTFSGDYTYYVIVAREEFFLDSIQGSDGSYFSGGWLETGNTSDSGNISGSPDGQYAAVGYQETDGTFRGFVVVANPGDWTDITVITDQVTSTIETSKTTYDAGEAIVVNFTNAAGNFTDWIGLYEAGAGNDQFLAWKLTGGVANGSVTFSNGLPNAGDYEARLFFDNTFNVEATCQFTVDPPCVVDVPDVYDMTESAAETVLTNAGLAKGTVTHEYSNVVAAGKVIDQDPDTGTSVACDSSVNLVISDGQTNVEDLETFASYWLDDSCSATGWCEGMDVNHDGETNFDDWAIFANYWHKGGTEIWTSKSNYDISEAIVVNFSDASGNAMDWIGLYEAGAAKDAPISWFYTDGTKSGTAGITAGAVTFSGLPDNGYYEARLFFGNSYIVEAADAFDVVVIVIIE